MGGPLTINSTTDSPADPPGDTTAPAPVSTAVVSLTKAELDAIIARAVKAGRDDAMTELGALTVPAAVVPDWTVNEFVHALVRRTRWVSEAEVRAAVKAADTHFPVPADDPVEA